MAFKSPFTHYWMWFKTSSPQLRKKPLWIYASPVHPSVLFRVWSFHYRWGMCVYARTAKATVVLSTDGWKVSLTYYTNTWKGQRSTHMNNHTQTQSLIHLLSGQLTPKPFISREEKWKIVPLHSYTSATHTLYSHCHVFSFCSSLLGAQFLLFFSTSRHTKKKGSGLSVAYSSRRGKEAKKKHSTGCGFQMSISECWKHKSHYSITFWKETKREIHLRQGEDKKGNEM